VDDPTLYSAAGGALAAPVAAVGRMAWRAICAFGPTALHAQTSCFRQGLSLAATSFTLAAATVAVGGTYPVSWLAFGGYLAIWGKWTADLMSYTECRNIRGRFAR
jgi:hypothetical protein